MEKVEAQIVEEPEVIVKNKTAANTTNTTETVEEDLLAITGNIGLSIDKITYDNKGSWAK